MRALNGFAGPETEATGSEPQKIVGVNERNARSFKPQPKNPQAFLPNTAMAAAFLRALAKWSARHASTDKITLPTGIVTGGELLRAGTRFSWGKPAAHGLRPNERRAKFNRKGNEL